MYDEAKAVEREISELLDKGKVMPNVISLKLEPNEEASGRVLLDLTATADPVDDLFRVTGENPKDNSTKLYFVREGQVKLLGGEKDVLKQIPGLPPAEVVEIGTDGRIINQRPVKEFGGNVPLYGFDEFGIPEFGTPDYSQSPTPQGQSGRRKTPTSVDGLPSLNQFVDERADEESAASVFEFPPKSETPGPSRETAKPSAGTHIPAEDAELYEGGTPGLTQPAGGGVILGRGRVLRVEQGVRRIGCTLALVGMGVVAYLGVNAGISVAGKAATAASSGITSAKEFVGERIEDRKLAKEERERLKAAEAQRLWSEGQPERDHQKVIRDLDKQIDIARRELTLDQMHARSSRATHAEQKYEHKKEREEELKGLVTARDREQLLYEIKRHQRAQRDLLFDEVRDREAYEYIKRLKVLDLEYRIADREYLVRSRQLNLERSQAHYKYVTFWNNWTRLDGVSRNQSWNYFWYHYPW